MKQLFQVLGLSRSGFRGRKLAKKEGAATSIIAARTLSKLGKTWAISRLLEADFLLEGDRFHSSEVGSQLDEPAFGILEAVDRRLFRLFGKVLESIG